MLRTTAFKSVRLSHTVKPLQITLASVKAAWLQEQTLIWAWWYKPIIPVLTRKRQEAEFKAILSYVSIQVQDSQDYIERPYLKTKKANLKVN